MSFELNKKDARVLYLNFSQRGDGKLETSAEQIFSFSSLIEDSSKYVVSVERFRLSITQVPARDAILNAFTLRSKTAAEDIFVSTIVSFGLYEWLLQINNSNSPLNLTLSADGRVRILGFPFDDFSLEIDPIVAAFLGFETTIDGAGTISVLSSTPVFDNFDQFQKISIEALNGLGNIQQEISDSGKVFVTQLTDFLIPSSFSMSVTNTTGAILNNSITFSMPVRQDIEYNSNARRYINFRGTSPIQNVKVRVVAIYKDGSRHPIIIPNGSIFECKLAFFRKG